MTTASDNQGRWERWLVPVVLLALCAGGFWITTTFDRMPPILKRGIQPADFPQLVIGLIVALTIIMAWRNPVRVTDRLSGMTWASLSLMAVFPALTMVDFFLALAVFAAALAFLWGERRLQILGLVGLLIPLAVFLLFDLVFEIRFPRGLLTNLWYG